MDKCRKQIKENLRDIMPHLNLEPDTNFDALGPHQLCNRMPKVVKLRNINMAPLEVPHLCVILATHDLCDCVSICILILEHFCI